MEENEQKLMKVIMQASIELIQTYNTRLSVEMIQVRMVRIAGDLVDGAEAISNEVEEDE